MKIPKRLVIYLVLLIIAIVAMVWIWSGLNSGANKSAVSRDLMEILESNELNVVTDYNSIGYLVQGDTVRGFQIEMM